MVSAVLAGLQTFSGSARQLGNTVRLESDTKKWKKKLKRLWRSPCIS
jgi:hypothetical protein